jgi:hypothetical protein
MHTQQCYLDRDKANGHYKAETTGKVDATKEAPIDDYQN